MHQGGGGGEGGHQYCGGSFSAVEVAHYSGGCFSAVGDNNSTCRRDNISTVGDTSVLWREFSTVEGYLQCCGGITAVHVGG